MNKKSNKPSQELLDSLIKGEKEFREGLIPEAVTLEQLFINLNNQNKL